MSKSKKQVITQESLDTPPEFDKFFAKEGLKGESGDPQQPLSQADHRPTVVPLLCLP